MKKLIYSDFIRIMPQSWKVRKGRFGFYNMNQEYIDLVRICIKNTFIDLPSLHPIFIELEHFLPYNKKQQSKKLNNNELTIYHLKKPDVTNLNKQMEDCMTGIIYKDDAQVIEICGKKHYSLVVGTKIKVYEIL